MRRKININGSSQESLVEDYQKALNALSDCLENMSTVMPHGRDYLMNEHPQNDYKSDRQEHLNNVVKIHEVRQYLHNCIVSIGTQ